MRSNKAMVDWCLKKNKGIKLDTPNPEISQQYLKKARGSLKMLSAALKNEETEWVAITAYYARYDAVYALFQKCGIVSEIHDCTLAALAFLFVEEGIVDSKWHAELVESKHNRIESQYYVAEEADIEPAVDADRAREFVLAFEEIIDKLDKGSINIVRDKLKILL